MFKLTRHRITTEEDLLDNKGVEREELKVYKSEESGVSFQILNGVFDWRTVFQRFFYSEELVEFLRNNALEISIIPDRFKLTANVAPTLEAAMKLRPEDVVTVDYYTSVVTRGDGRLLETRFIFYSYETDITWNDDESYIEEEESFSIIIPPLFVLKYKDRDFKEIYMRARQKGNKVYFPRSRWEKVKGIAPLGSNMYDTMGETFIDFSTEEEASMFKERLYEG